MISNTEPTISPNTLPQINKTLESEMMQSEMSEKSVLRGTEDDESKSESDENMRSGKTTGRWTKIEHTKFLKGKNPRIPE